MRTIAALLLTSMVAAQQGAAPSWSEFGGGPEHRNASDAKLPPNLAVAWKKDMGCPMPGRAQFVAGGGLLYGSSP